MKKRSAMIWWVGLRLALGQKVLVMVPDGENAKDLAEACRPKNKAQLTQHNRSETEWHFHYEGGAQLTVRTASWTEKDI